MDMESDMLQRYTQHTLVDDLLPPESTLPLLSQEVDIETRRGGMLFPILSYADVSHVSVGALPHIDDSFDMLDGGMDLEPLSDEV